jgi:glycosyltransferase involved in cell wall biosynthesis
MDGEFSVRVTERATDRRGLDQHLREAGEPGPPQNSLGRLGAGDPLNELPDRHWTALGRTKPALLLSGAVTDGRPTLRHLGVNALFLEPRMGGIETYVRELYPAILEARPDLRISMFLNDQGRELIASEPWSGGVQLVNQPLLGIRGARALSEALLLDSVARRRRCQLLHSVALTAPLRPHVPSVVMVADVTWLREPDAVPRLTRTLWKSLVIPAARRARRLIAISNSARDEIAEDFRVPLDRIDVIPLGPGINGAAEPTPEPELRDRLALGTGPVILAVSAFLAHKNPGRLVEAMPAIRAEVPDVVLVLPGNWTPLQDDVRDRARTLGVEGAVIFPGWVNAADLEGLYHTATAFVLPSRREGFGLPVLEAMRRGVPVACSTTSALPEVAGDAAIYFDPERPEEIAAAVTAILRDPGRAAELSEKGRKRARLFTWRRTAEETLACFDRALA